MPKGGNAGLWYDKFCHRWQDREWKIEPQGRKDWIGTVTNGRVGDSSALQEAVSRTLDLLAGLHGEARFFATAGRFVTGLGRSHPLENGFAWHPTLGVPFLPASSVKGMVRSWVEFWLEEKEKARRIFGSQGEVGTVIFLDALPAAPVQLEREVMTPHYQDYYSGKPDCPPGDWYDPNPINFLAVAKGQPFVFGVAARDPERNAADLAAVLACLPQALENIGAGAKTAAGYGRFVPDRASDVKWENQKKQERARLAEKERIRESAAALARLSPLRREMEEDGYSETPTDRFMGNLTTKWLKRMEGAEPPERREIADLLMTWYQEKLPDVLRKPNKKNEEKIDRIKRAQRD